jgi:hypothetical protein
MSDHQVGSYGLNVTTDKRPANDAGALSSADHTGIHQYEIRVKGHLGPHWAAWFDGLSLVNEDDGITVIRGELADQAALHGVLHKLRDIGIPLVSLTQLPSDAATEPSALDTTEGN